LLLDYGLRKGALQAVRFKHFDHQRRRLTIFTKGQKVRELPLPHRVFWHDLEHHILDIGPPTSCCAPSARSRASSCAATPRSR
jgi:hypothetical protein